MKKKRLLMSTGFLAACICLLVAVIGMIVAQPRVTKPNFDRIENGMTKEEVQEIFGTTAPIRTIPARAPDPGIWEYWEADDRSAARIKFVDNCVAEKVWFEFGETRLDKIRRWLHLF